MGRVVLANRERPIIVEPMGRGLRGITLRYAHEVRSEMEYLADIPKIALPDEMLQITKHILDTKLADFDPAYLEDRYRTVLAEKLREKKAQMPAQGLPAASPSPQNVINLMDALRRSVEGETKGADKSGAQKSEAKKAESKQSEGKQPKAARKGKARLKKAG